LHEHRIEPHFLALFLLQAALVEKLNEAAVGGDVNKMRELLNTPGVNIDAKYQGSETPLITACYEGHLPVAQLLIERGANINLKDSVGGLPFHRNMRYMLVYSLPNTRLCLLICSVAHRMVGRRCTGRPTRCTARS
jgi:ankyrin repeat protein